MGAVAAAVIGGIASLAAGGLSAAGAGVSARRQREKEEEEAKKAEALTRQSFIEQRNQARRDQGMSGLALLAQQRQGAFQNFRRSQFRDKLLSAYRGGA